MSNVFVNSLGRFLRWLPDGVVFGSTFRGARTVQGEYSKTKDPVGFIQDYQHHSLRRILSMAETVPYYRAHHFQMDVNHFDQVPFVDKSIMRADITQFVRTRKGAVYGTTGGTSGKPFGFYIDKNRRGFEWFWMTDNWSRVGFDRKRSYRAVLRNHILNKNRLYRDNTLLRELDFANYHLTDEYLTKMVEVIAERDIEFVHAYPSAAYRLAKYLQANNRRLPSVKAFLCGSENIYPEQRAMIEECLGVRMFSWYGHSEKLILAGECERSSFYHAVPFYGYAEMIDENGRAISEPGVRGELVGTGFINTKMPFIRYRTGDCGTFVGNQCPHCGRHGLIFRDVEGRWGGEKVYASDGTYVTTTALNMHSDIYENIQGMQYYQDTPGKIEVRIIPDNGFTDKDVQRIRSELKAKLGPEMDISLKTVKELEYTENRKFKLLVQNISWEQ